MVVENLEATARRDLTDGRRMKSVVVVTVAALHKYAAVAEALGEHLASHVVQVDTCQYSNAENVPLLIAISVLLPKRIDPLHWSGRPMSPFHHRLSRCSPHQSQASSFFCCRPERSEQPVRV